MQNDNYVIDDNGAWGDPTQALEWYRKALATEKERADYAWRNTRTIEAARQEEMAKRDKLTKALRAAERFVAGFESDELQEGIDELLTEIRTALDIYPIPEFLRRNHG